MDLIKKYFDGGSLTIIPFMILTITGVEILMLNVYLFLFWDIGNQLSYFPILRFFFLYPKYVFYRASVCNTDSNSLKQGSVLYC